MNANRMQMGTNPLEVRNFLADVNVNSYGQNSVNNSNLAIEVEDVDSRRYSTTKPSRA